MSKRPLLLAALGASLAGFGFSGGTTSANQTDKTQEQQAGDKHAHLKVDIDAAFLKAVAEASLAETRLGQLGADRAQDSRLASLSQNVAQDSQRTYQRLQQLANREHVSLPNTPDLKQQLALDQLASHVDDPSLARQLIREQAALLGRLQAAKDQLHRPELQQEASHLTTSVRKQLSQAKEVAQAVGLSNKDIESAVRNQLEAAGAANLEADQQGSQSGQGASSSATNSDDTDPGLSQLKLDQSRHH